MSAIRSSSPSKKITYDRSWRARNPDKVRVYNQRSRAHMKANPPLYIAMRNRSKLNQAKRRLTVDGTLNNILYHARYRSKIRNISFDLTLEYLHDIYPKDGCCPFMQAPFVLGGHHELNISLDRIIPALGYVQGNIQIISRCVNTMKQNCIKPEVFRRMADYLEKHHGREMDARSIFA